MDLMASPARPGHVSHRSGLEKERDGLTVRTFCVDFPSFPFSPLLPPFPMLDQVFRLQRRRAVTENGDGSDGGFSRVT
jgi:hypothetical protein